MSTSDSRFSSLSSAVVKLTNRCNIRCDYCYEKIVSRGSDMTSEVFQRAIFSILSATSKNSFLLILHGGEPTVLSAAWFAENLAAARSIAESCNVNLDITIQSNLIKISDEKLRIFRDYNVRLGGSLDNPSFIADSMRPLADRALATYMKAKELGLRVGILSTINASNVTRMFDFCRWLHQDVGIDHFKANIAYPVGAGINLGTLAPDAISQAQKAILEYMIANRGDFFEENLSQEIIRFYETAVAKRGRPGSLCDDKTCGAGTRVVGIAPSGALLPCGRFAWNDTAHYLGELAPGSESCHEFRQKIDNFQILMPENWLHCDTCDASSICGFGCQAFIVRSKQQANIECEPTKLRFAYYQEHSEDLQSLYQEICKFMERPAMSPLEQQLSRLSAIVPEKSRHAVSLELLNALETSISQRSYRENADL